MRIVFPDQFRQLIFQSGGRPEGGAVRDRFDDAFPDCRVIMAQYQRSPGTAEVNELVFVLVPDMTALPFFDKQRNAFHRLEGPYRRIHAAREMALCRFIEFIRTRTADLRGTSQGRKSIFFFFLSEKS